MKQDSTHQSVNQSLNEAKLMRSIRRLCCKCATPVVALQWMVRVLRDLEGPVVGVVGLGHLDGIERIWKQHDEQQHQQQDKQQQVDTAA